MCVCVCVCMRYICDAIKTAHAGGDTFYAPVFTPIRGITTLKKEREREKEKQTLEAWRAKIGENIPMWRQERH